jgi:hypothetical protein
MNGSLTRTLGNRLSGNTHGCYPEAGSGTAPEREQRNTARIPDAIVRRQELPRVTFEIISPSELEDWRARDRKRLTIQMVAGVSGSIIAQIETHHLRPPHMMGVASLTQSYDRSTSQSRPALRAEDTFRQNESLSAATCTYTVGNGRLSSHQKARQRRTGADASGR